MTCALVAADDAKQRWLLSAGVLPLLRRLTAGRALAGAEAGDAAADALAAEDGRALGVRRAAARLLAILSADAAAQTLFWGCGWQRWLEAAAAAEDCKLSSHAARALLHLESARAFAPPATAVVGAAGFGAMGGGAAAAPPGAAPGARLVLRDGVHLFSPGAGHHGVLAREGAAARSPGAPGLDVVFVHGLRGGPFATWRRERGAGRAALGHHACWPSAWLAQDLPAARLLSMQYAAPASGWEGESLPLWGTVGQLLDRLTAAGVGGRPVVFVCHSMGGVLVKEMLARAAAAGAPAHHRALADATAGLVTYSTPHRGSWLADVGWNLRYLGASPAASVVHLKPGRHLEAVNDLLAARHAAGRLPVLAFAEGVPLSLAPVLPKLIVVPEASAFPGYGEAVVLPVADHITTCKPTGRADAAYARLLDFLRARAAEAAAAAE